MKKRIFLSTVDQGLLSVLNFSINIFLIKIWSTEYYGVYSIIFALCIVQTGLQNALINTPYSVNFGQSKKNKFELINIFFCILIPITISYIFLKIMSSIDINYLYLFLYFFSFLYKEYLRNKWIVNKKINNALVSDLSYIIIILLSYSFINLNTPQFDIDINLFLIIFSMSGLISIIVGLKSEILSIISTPLSISLNYSSTWKQSRWSLIGVMTTELQNRSYIFIITTFFGLEILGIIQAGRVFFGPLNLLISGWGRVVRPVLAKLYQNNNIAKFKKIINISYLSFLLVNIAFGFFIFLFWDVINSNLYDNKFDNILHIVIQWGVVNLFLHIRSVSSVGLQATNRFDLLSFATVIGATSTLISLSLIVYYNIPFYAISSIILSEILAFLIIYQRLSMQLNKVIK